MFFTYLGRELSKRRKQTLIVSLGMALALTLVVLMSGISTGIATTQQKALAAVYGVGTNLTVTKAVSQADSSTGQQFKFGANAGSTSGSSDTTKSLSSSRLEVTRGTSAYAQSVLTTVSSTAHVSAAAGVLLLSNTDFSGQVPSGNAAAGAQPTGTRPTQGANTSSGSGPSSFNINSVSVAGVTPTRVVGPLSSVQLTSGRLLASSDASAYVAVLDASYAKSADKAVGDTIKIGGKSFKVVGIVKNTSATSTASTNVYIPLKTAQKVSGETNKISTVYVKADSAANINAIDTTLTAKLKSYTINTESELASTVANSAGTATGLIQTFGFWVVILALAAAFLLAILFTISGVSRRTRELGTLKSLGWSNGRIVRQITGESIVQALLGGVLGSALGVAGIVILNAIHPTLSSATSSTLNSGPGGPGAAATAIATPLTAILTPDVIVYAFAIALLGGILAGVFGAIRASRLRPAEALRSI